MKTVAEQIGQTPHVSPLLRRLRRMGLDSSEKLRKLAVARGCHHYRQPNDDLFEMSDEYERISNVELAIAMVTAAQEFDPILIRCAAQLLSDDQMSVEAIVRVAVQERAVPIVKHIADAGLILDEGNEERWRQLIAKLPKTSPISAGRLPHKTRFVSQFGVARIEGKMTRSPVSVWLKPKSNSHHEK